MDWGSVSDWIFKGIIVFVAVRYGWFGEREIRALRAEKQRLEPLTGAAFADREKRLTNGYKRATEELENKDKEIESLKVIAGQKKEIETAMEEIQQEKKKEISRSHAAVLRAMGIGFLDGARAVQEIIEFYGKQRGLFGELMLPEKLVSVRDSLYEQAENAFSGKRPDISRVAQFMARSG